MIGTHDSLTAYPLKKSIHKLIAPLVLAVSRTQSKTIRRQYDAGCRSFDFRFAYYKNEWYAAHGAALFNITFEQAMQELDSLPESVFVRIVAEDSLIKCDIRMLDETVKSWFIRHNRTKVRLIQIASKTNWNYQTSFPTCIEELCIYDNHPITENDRDSLCEKVAMMYELRTTDDRINIIGCYESGGIPLRICGWQPKIGGYPAQIPYPKLAAKALTKIALRKRWKANDIPIVDFL